MTGTAVAIYKGPQLATYDAASAAIAKCAHVDDALHLKGLTAMAQAYAKQVNDVEAKKNWAIVMERAKRRLGEILIEMEATGARHGSGSAKGERRGAAKGKNAIATPQTGALPPTISELGLTHHQALQWQKLAKLPPKKFEEHVAIVAGTAARPKRTPAKQTTKQTRRPKKATGKEPSMRQQVNAYHAEAVNYMSDFRDRYLEWFGAHPNLNSAQRAVLIEALTLCADAFRKLAQATDGR